MIAILLIIESRGQVKAKELAEALETSVRTIHRDVAALCEAGIPLAASTGPTGGISLMDGCSTRMSSMQCDDVISQVIEDGTVRAILNFHKYELATGEVLSLIGMAEILSPQELRQHASSKLKELADLYGN